MQLIIDKVLFRLFGIKPSFSQMGEDRIIRHLFNWFNKKNISYLDIGANDPSNGNNTYYFYREGGRGVCVEPNPALCKRIKKVRPKDICINAGIGNGEEIVADFYSMNIHSLSTFSKIDAQQLQETGKYKINEVLKIPLKNINSIIEGHFQNGIDLISIDVEGWNEQIIESFDFTRCRPFCFCIETLSFALEGEAQKMQKIFNIMEKNEYKVYADTYLNTIFLNKDLKLPLSTA